MSIPIPSLCSDRPHPLIPSPPGHEQRFQPCPTFRGSVSGSTTARAAFKALVGSAVGLVGAFSSAICIRDGETFRYRAGAGPGYSEKVQRFIESAPVLPGRGLRCPSREK